VRNLFFYWGRFAGFAETAGIIVTLALLPIDRLPYLHHIPFGLGMLSLILLLAATGDKLARRYSNKDYRLLKKYALIGSLLALPVLGCAASSIHAIDRTVALSATKLMLAVTLRAFCFFVLLSEKPSLWLMIKKTIYAVTAVVVAFGFFQFFADVFGASQSVTDLRDCCTSNSTYVFPRVYSAALEPLYLDHFLLIPLWLLTFDFLKIKSARKNRYLVGLFLATATLFILTLARSADIGILIAALIFYLAAKHQKNLRDFWKYLLKAWGKALLIAMVLVALSGVVALFIPKNALHGSRSGFGSVGLFGSHEIDVIDGSAQTRYSLWPKSIGYMKEHPLAGVGANNSRIRLDLYDYHRGVSPNRLQPFNNDLISLLVDLGLVGVLTFGPLLVILIWVVVRLYKSRWAATSSAMALILIGMLIQGNFFQSLLLTRLWVVIGILLATLSMPPINRIRVNHETSN
jgi:O-antigen ligase